MRVLLWTLFIASPLAIAQEATIAAKVEALTHPRYAEREKAARDLDAIGEPTLNALKTAMMSGDVELSTRAAQVHEKIDRRVRSQRILAAPKLSFDMDNIPLAIAMQQFNQATGLRLSYEPVKGNKDSRVTLKTREVPYWQAVAEFYEAAGLQEKDEVAVSPESKIHRMPAMNRAIIINGASEYLDRAIVLTDGVAATATDSRSALRVRAVPAAYAANKFDAATDELTFHLDIDAVPALDLRQIVGVQLGRVLPADGGTAKPIYPASTSSFSGMVMYSGDDWVVGSPPPAFHPVVLKCGPVRPRELKLVEGVVVAQVMSPPETLATFQDIFNPDKPPDAEGDYQCRGLPIGEVSTSSYYLHVRVTMIVPPDPTSNLNIGVNVKGKARPFIRINRVGGPRSGQNVIPGAEPVVRDAEGKPVRVVGTRVVQTSFDGSGMKQEIELQLDKPATGSKGINLSLMGRRLVEVEMPFVLRDVRLP